MYKILIVFGTRPEAIKMCPLVNFLKQNKNVESVVCLTGQHREMLRSVMDVFRIKEEYNLDIMRSEQTLATITSDVLKGVSEVLEKEQPDIVLVHGDTTTSYASALAAFYKGIPVGHVEAGLRTYDMQAPFPEEFNRQSVDLISDLYFAPTETAKNNLIKEGKNRECIYVTGNTVIDALLTTIKKDYTHEQLNWVGNARLVLVTAHRRENIGIPMRQMFSAIKKIADEYEDVKVIYPIHMNPKVREIAEKILNNHERIRLIEPMELIDFHNFMARSYLILTDSGGIQEEAPALGKPVLVMRNTTERPEGIAAGTLKLVGTSEEGIYKNVKMLLDSKNIYESMSKATNPYGDGHASERIVEAIENYFRGKENAKDINSITSI